eukprot:787880-Alexandrium_andersonii.AAC.1
MPRQGRPARMCIQRVHPAVYVAETTQMIVRDVDAVWAPTRRGWRWQIGHGLCWLDDGVLRRGRS